VMGSSGALLRVQRIDEHAFARYASVRTTRTLGCSDTE
jgi:hypothetical protein